MKTQSIYLAHFKLIVLLSFSLFACSQEANDGNVQNEIDGDVSFGKEAVLFIGNSHTYYNQGISSHLSKFRDNDNLGFKPLIQEVAVGGYSLQDHLSDQTTLDKINERSWDAILDQRALIWHRFPKRRFGKFVECPPAYRTALGTARS